MKGRQRSRPAERFVGESAIGQSVSREHKGRKIHQHTSIIIANKTASWLFEVCPEAIDRHCKARDMKSMPNKNPLSVEGDDGRTAAQDRKVRVIPIHTFNPEVALYDMNADLSGNM